MNAVPQRVLKLVLEDDTCPIDDWLQSLRDKVTRARIARQIDRLERGNFGDHKDVGKDVSELRLFFGPGYRVYYGMMEGAIIVLLAGGDKSSQARDISRAQALWEAFLTEGQPEEALFAWAQMEPSAMITEEERPDETEEL